MSSDPLIAAVKLAYRFEPSLLAWHEAGHALAAWQIGAPIIAIRMDLGRCTGETPVRWGEGHTVHEALVLHAAGEIGERMAPAWRGYAGALRGLLPGRDPADRCWANVQQCLRAIVGFGQDRQDDLLAETHRQLQRLLADNRTALERLAKRLLADQYLDGVAVHRLLQGG